MDPYLQSALVGLVFGAAALLVFAVSMRSDRWIDAYREKKRRERPR